MKNSKRWIVSLIGLVAGAACLHGAVALAYIPHEPPMCPDVYAPVICDGGAVYSNGCYATLANATGCVPFIPGSDS